MRQNIVRPRPGPRPESARPRLRPRPRPKICYETETKNYETETSPVKLIAGESNTNRHVSFLYYIHDVNDEPEMDFAFKMISK